MTALVPLTLAHKVTPRSVVFLNTWTRDVGRVHHLHREPTGTSVRSTTQGNRVTERNTGCIADRTHLALAAARKGTVEGDRCVTV